MRKLKLISTLLLTITCALAASSVFAADTRRKESNSYGDHIGAYNFMVEISGVEAGYFKGVDGLNAEVEVVEFQDGDDLFLRRRPGRAKFGNVTLTKGFIVTSELQTWWKRGKKRGKRTVKLTLQQFPTKKGRRIKGAKLRKLCAYTLHNTKLKTLDAKQGGEAKTVLVPGKVTHSCQSIMLAQGEKPTRRFHKRKTRKH